jgi:hypothetical protein
MSGSKLSANNGSLRSALGSLREVLTSSLGDKCQCTGIFSEIESTIDRIEQKLNDLVIGPNPGLDVVGENLSVDAQEQFSFALEAAVVTSVAASEAY